MTIQLPNDLKSSIQAVVNEGLFATVDDAMAEAARLLLRELDRLKEFEPRAADPGHGSIGAMRDSADELDQIVADAYRHRREDTWRDLTFE